MEFFNGIIILSARKIFPRLSGGGFCVRARLKPRHRRLAQALRTQGGAWTLN